MTTPLGCTSLSPQAALMVGTQHPDQGSHQSRENTPQPQGPVWGRGTGPRALLCRSITRVLRRRGRWGAKAGGPRARAPADVQQDGVACLVGSSRARTQVCSGMLFSGGGGGGPSFVWFGGHLFPSRNYPTFPFCCFISRLGASTHLSAFCEQVLPDASKMGIAP